jgi:hypothetical protein
MYLQKVCSREFTQKRPISVKTGGKTKKRHAREFYLKNGRLAGKKQQ